MWLASKSGAVRKALEGGENTSVRASLLFEPSDTFTAYVKAEFIDNDDLPQVRRRRVLEIRRLADTPAAASRYTLPSRTRTTIRNVAIC